MIVIVCQTFFQFLDMFGWQEGHPSHKTQTTYRQRFSCGMNGGGQRPGLMQWACYKKASAYGSRVGWTPAGRIHTYIHTTQQTRGKCGGECPTRKKLWNTRKLEKRSKIQLLDKACSATCDACVCGPANNACRQRVCSHLCLPQQGYPGFTCACPNTDDQLQYSLDSRGLQCIVSHVSAQGQY